MMKWLRRADSTLYYLEFEGKMYLDSDSRSTVDKAIDSITHLQGVNPSKVAQDNISKHFFTTIDVSSKDYQKALAVLRSEFDMKKAQLIQESPTLDRIRIEITGYVQPDSAGEDQTEEGLTEVIREHLQEVFPDQYKTVRISVLRFKKNLFTIKIELFGDEWSKSVRELKSWLRDWVTPAKKKIEEETF